MIMNYEQLAYYYDVLMEDAPYDKWESFTKAMIAQTGKPVSSIIDLGCGTGQITTRLAKSGYRMTGVDYSADMLTIAHERAARQRLNVQFIQQDLRKLEGFRHYDVAISYCDVLNYITEEDELRSVFQHVAALLKSEGLFIFDIHSLDYVHNHLINQTFADVTDDVAYVWFCSVGDEEGEMHHDLTLFARDKSSGQYIRFDEYHHQRTYPVTFYKQLLDEAGFDIQHLSSNFSIQDNAIDEMEERLFITAIKRSEE
ncbi:class I SAM-dependent methyltransferase [Lentibacillus cibarius]|uniref:Class I SAM-dependent methyltransferase n=2 Tax=Lentibacillus cibarius TaxID=2583219 RepID=A0A549YLL9_9BACI|nr:class I SAM-dependent methyltransferase [Lentibacillus cibarius]